MPPNQRLRSDNRIIPFTQRPEDEGLKRRRIPLARVERGCSDLLRTEFRFVVTDVGGCAVDIDNEHDWDMVLRRYPEWSRAQAEKAERLCGPLPLPERAATGSE